MGCDQERFYFVRVEKVWNMYKTIAFTGRGVYFIPLRPQLLNVFPYGRAAHPEILTESLP
jgi:hypothetical protein